MSDVGQETAKGAKRTLDELNATSPDPTNPFNLDLNKEPLVDLPPGSRGEFGRDSIPGTGSSKEHGDLELQDLSTTIPP